MLLEGKKALITGASRGIGEAIALNFAKNGADIILHYYENAEDSSKSLIEEAKKVAAEIEKIGRKVFLLGFDLSNREMIESKIKDIPKDFAPEILINNAGLTADNLAMRMKPSEWERVINVNLSGSFFVTKALMRTLLRNQGKIVFIASVIAQMGNAGQANYAASKAGLIGMAKSLARELASKKVRVNCIAPGFIETQMTQAMPESAKQSLLDIVPLKETGKPEDIANAALFLSSDLSKYITGEVLKVNGGMYM
jgi:3-oxoacyl-[acyl-carrier protein] reductase